MSQSFYGGVAGRPFVLKRKYLTIQEMVNDFKIKEGHNDYNAQVDFGEYVIIESINKNNPENGRIFRRALDQTTTKPIEYWELATNKDGTVQNFFEKKTMYYNGAIYVGQIAGPSGDAPHFASLPTRIQDKNEDGLLAFDESGNPIYIEDGKLFDYDDIIDYYNTNGIDPITTKIDAVYDLHSGDGVFEVNNNHLVPGKTKDGNYNDNITWKWCSIRDELGQSSTAYVGFTFPYMVVDFTAISVSSYDNTKKLQYDNNGQPYYTYSNLSVRTDEDEHPFYEKWNFNIPKGIHGMDVKNVRCINIRDWSEEKRNKIVILTLNQDDQPYYDTSTHKLTYTPYVETHTVDGSHDRYIWVCDLIDYNISAKGDLYTIYLGDYNTITKIEMNTDKEVNSESGKITIDYSHNDEELLGQLTWVKSIYISEDGNVVVQSNNGTELLDSNQKTLTWPVTMRINESGEVIVDYTTAKGVVINKETPLGWISEATAGPVDTDEDGYPDDYYLSIKYNNDNFENIDKLSLKTVNDIYFDKGAIYSKYNIQTENGAYIVKHIGTVDESYKNIVAGQTEEEIKAGDLRIGGIWLVTDKPMPKPVEVTTINNETVTDSQDNIIMTWDDTVAGNGVE